MDEANESDERVDDNDADEQQETELDENISSVVDE
jgi:hypothetical protein